MDRTIRHGDHLKILIRISVRSREFKLCGHISCRSQPFVRRQIFCHLIKLVLLPLELFRLSLSKCLLVVRLPVERKLVDWELRLSFMKDVSFAIVPVRELILVAALHAPWVVLLIPLIRISAISFT